MRAKRRTKLSDQIRQAIDASGVSRYRICKQIGLDQALLSRFMQGRSGLSVQNLDALADVLRLRIVADGPPKVAPPEKSGPKPKKKGR